MRSTTRLVMLMALATGCSEPAPPAPEAEDGTGTTTEGELVTTSGSGSIEGSTGPAADGESTSGPAPTVTYHEHVRPLVERHCVQCHQPGNIGPFPLTTFDEVFAVREAVLLSVEQGTMPPWLAGPDCQDYLGDPSLSEDEIGIVHAWVEEGGPQGDPDDYVAPELPPPAELSRVDLTLEFPEPYVPVLQPDDYRCFLLDWPYEDTVYVSGSQALPDQLQMVHHVVTYAIGPEQVAEYEALDDADPGAGYTCFGGPGGAIDPSDPTTAGKWLGAWAPGGLSGDFPEGTGIPMEAGSKVVVQVHYNSAAGEPTADRSSVQFKIDRAVERPAAMMLWANPTWLGGGMPIPAGESEVTHVFELDPTPFMDFVTDVIPSNSPFRIHSSVIHMHTLGSSARASIVREGGDSTCLLDLPRYDFNWQQIYRFDEPETFNPGDRMRLACRWDNSAGDQAVNWGDGTGDEMCLGIFYVTEP